MGTSSKSTDATRLPSDHAMRTRFRTVLDRNAVVEAGAGTGKTTLVVERILCLVMGRDIGERGAAYPSGGLPVLAAPVRIERIVAITFTELAAAELAARVRDRMTEVLGAARIAGDGATEQLLVAALADLPRASITTIHGFCSRVLREYALEAGLDPSFETLDPVGAKALIEEVFETWFEEIGSRREVRRVLSFGLSLEAVEGHARSILELEVPKGISPGLGPAHTDSPLHSSIERFLLDAEAEARYFQTLVDAGVDFPRDPLANSYEALGALVAQHASLLDGSGTDADWDAFQLELMQPVWENGVPKGGSLSPKKWKDAVGDGETADYRDRLKHHKAMVLELRGQIGADLVAGIEPSLLEFRQHYKDEKARLAVLDFDDLLQLAEQLVRGNATVRGSLIERFATLFVDEFQDTSPIQASLVFFLSGSVESAGQQDWQQVVPAPGRLVLVGDPKQSIYRFRGADVETYKACCDLVCAADPEAMLQISTNFRTDGALVDWVNALFRSDTGRMEAPAEGGYQADYIDLLPWKVGEGCDAPVLVLTPADHERVPGSEPTLELEARSVARYLKDKLGAGPAALGPSGKAVGFGDTAIIARTRKTLAVYGPALAREGIPFVLEGGGNLFEQEEVLTALTLLTAITQPSRETAVVGSLRSVWFGISDDELAEHKLGGGTWNPADGNRGLGSPRVNDALAALGNLVQRSREVAPQELITELLRDGDHIALLRLRTSGIQGPMNLRMLESFLHGRLAAGGMSLAGALRLAENLTKRESKEAGARLASEGAVRLMTAHASKGLEFGLVILAQPGRKPSNKHADPWWDDEGLVWRLSKNFQHPRFETKKDWDKTRAAAEALRLFYVALTRAENYLMLPLFGSYQETKKDGVKSNLTVALSQSMGKYLQSQLAGFEEGDLPHGVTALTTPEASAGAPRPADEFVDELRLGLATPCAAMERSVEMRRRMAMGSRSLAPSSLGDAPVVTRSDQATSPEAARQMGVLAHRCIELGLDRQASLDLCLASKLDETEAGFVADCVHREASLPSSLRAQDADRVFHEPPVQWSTRDEHGNVVVMRGFIDRLIQLDDGSVEVVDFKTDRIEPEEMDDRAEHHKAQLALYGLALESAGLVVRSLTIAFLAIGQEVTIPMDDKARQVGQAALVR